MPIVIGIDGTGSAIIPGAGRDRDYDRDFANSFVKRICSTGGGTRGYLRGPVGLGGGLRSAVNGGYNFIKQKRNEGDSSDVLLTGYSRGAAGVIMIAKKLQGDNIPVKAMMLFDCVDRYLFGDASVIPQNVEIVKHVIRDPLAKSRHSFGNDGMRYHPPTVYPTIIKFMCTHGGMGGTPWVKPRDKMWTDLIDEGALEQPYNATTAISYQKDQDVSERIWSHCQIFMRDYGFVS